MSQLSLSRKKGLEIARNTFQYAAQNQLYVLGRGKTIRAFSFYDGDGQYPKSFLREWRSRFPELQDEFELPPPIINKVKARINHVSGVEIQSRFRTAYRTHSHDDNEKMLVNALTHQGYYIQERNEMPLIQTQKFRDMLVCGLGWSNIFLQDGEIWCEYIHPLNILYDADDFSPLMTDMQYVHRLHWVTKQTCLMLWPNYKKEIDELFFSAMPLPVGSYSSEFLNRIAECIDLYPIGGGDGIGSRIMVIETQRKEKRKYYRGIDNGAENGMPGRYFETFDEDAAKEMIGKGEKIVEKDGYQIIRTVFCNDIVFEHGPLNPNLPNGNFTYVPGVYSRRSSDAVPEGWLAAMEDIQRIINFSKAKDLLMRNSLRAIVDTGALVDGQTPEELQEQLSRHNAVIFKNKEANITLHPNNDLADSQIKESQRLDEELQQVSGLYSDSLGEQTNATASVSINSRTKNSFRTQIIGFDNLMFMKKREAKLMLDLMQGGGMENMSVSILDDEEKQTIILNLAVEVDGKIKIFNDVRNLNVGVYVELTHDYESSPEERREFVQNLMNNPNGLQMLQSPYFPFLLKEMDQRGASRFGKELEKINKQIQNQQMLANMNNVNANQPMSGQEKGREANELLSM